MKNNTHRHLPRVAALHDLSAFGRCALTVVIPTLSAIGIQTVPVPTALLSTHTGGFTDMYFCDLEPSIGAIGDHFASIGLDFDSIYTGFLGSDKQVKTVESFIDSLSGPDTLIFVDPVMGDNGLMYSACSPELIGEMRRLCAKANVITPNLTEAALLTSTPYPDTRDMSSAEAERIARELMSRIRDFTDAECVITGIHFEDGVGTYTPLGMHTEKARKRDYPGTGDLFASVMLGHLLRASELSGETVSDAARYASAFTARVIDYSVKYGESEPSRDGVLLEGMLPELCIDFRRED